MTEQILDDYSLLYELITENVINMKKDHCDEDDHVINHSDDLVDCTNKYQITKGTDDNDVDKHDIKYYKKQCNEHLSSLDITLENSLIILSSSVINIKNLSKEFVDTLNKDAQNKLTEKNITDHERYILNHKLDALKDIRI